MSDTLAWALDYAARGIAVLPLAPGTKMPAIPKTRGGRGYLDATTDAAQIAAWWREYPGANIGGRPPSGVAVLDIESTAGKGVDGMSALLALADGRPIPMHTLMGLSGSSGLHLWLEVDGPYRPKYLVEGVEIKHGGTGYVVLPPSVHPDTGREYLWVSAPGALIEVAPPWLAEAMQRPPVPPRPLLPPPNPARRLLRGPSIADDFNESTTWHEVLGPHGWRCARGDGDGDASIWLHPNATSACSASVRGGRLYVYSTSTVFETTEGGAPRGYSKFEAAALLNHGGDMRAAAATLRTTQAGEVGR